MLQFQNLLVIYHTRYTAILLIDLALMQVTLQDTSDISHFLSAVLYLLVEFFFQISFNILLSTSDLHLSS
ncbi:hypothetical protein AXF42_Ash020783 [Apostasia shenzhenica]|uniref:Uncharacterized protein n=1 Tax=Apostasia shenzhenica TaxID=1088818 RepID=A0A2I0A4L0_9ASPA|nr:hypothetical protein AXF42_Ash020783 [Apostasia shenzhenica]